VPPFLATGPPAGGQQEPSVSHTPAPPPGIVGPGYIPFPVPTSAPPPRGPMTTPAPGPTIGVMPPVIPSPYRTPTPSDVPVIPSPFGTPRPPTIIGHPGVYRPPIPSYLHDTHDEGPFIPSRTTSSSGSGRSASPPRGSVVRLDHPHSPPPVMIMPPSQQPPITVQPPPPVVVGTQPSRRDSVSSSDRESPRDQPLHIQPLGPPAFHAPPMGIPPSTYPMPSEPRVGSPRHPSAPQSPPIVIRPSSPMFVPSQQPSIVPGAGQGTFIIHPPAPGPFIPGPSMPPQVIALSRTPSSRSRSRTRSRSRSPRRDSQFMPEHPPPFPPTVILPTPTPAVVLPSGAPSGGESRRPSDRSSPRSADVPGTPGIYPDDGRYRPPSVIPIPQSEYHLEDRRSPYPPSRRSETPESEYDRDRDRDRDRRRRRRDRDRDRDRDRGPYYSETDSDPEARRRYPRRGASRRDLSPDLDYVPPPGPVVHVPRSATVSRTEGVPSIGSPRSAEFEQPFPPSHTPVLPVPEPSVPRAASFSQPVVVTPSAQRPAAPPTIVEIGRHYPEEIDIHSSDEPPPRVIPTRMRSQRTPPMGKFIAFIKADA